MAETSSSDSISTRCQRIAELARKAPEMRITTLAHHIDVEWLREAYRRTRKDGAVGIDGTTAAEYATKLGDNLQDLLNRAKSGAYHAPAVRRVHIPKASGTETRPIGIPTFEDKVLQRAVAMVLEAVYEQDFLDCSFGFRTGRSPLGALNALRDHVMATLGCWVVEVDIRKFFDTLDHAQLRGILNQRIGDGVLLRLIGKWLHAGVLERGSLSFPEAGTPQGGVISPLLANIYLHTVVDLWFERTVKPCLHGTAFMVRFADDFVMGFTLEADARRVLAVLPKRFGKYGLTLHPTKTRLLPFYPPRGRASGRGDSDAGKPGTFNFLGFTHYWDRSRRGYWVVRWQTAKDRYRRGLRALSDWFRRVRHEPLREQHRLLVLKLNGHAAYYGVTGNGRALSRFFDCAKRLWHKWLARRSQKAHASWAWFSRMLWYFPFPRPRIVHSVMPRPAKP